MSQLDEILNLFKTRARDAYSVSRPPAAGITTSNAPGVGATQERTHTNYPDAARTAPMVPKPSKSDARGDTGYGGGGDAIVLVPPPDTGKLRTRPRPSTMPGPLRPNYNELYGPLRTKDGWYYTVEDYAQASLTQPVGAATTTALASIANVTNPSTGTNLNLSRYPGAISVYRCIILLSLAPNALTATGAYALTLQPYASGSAAGKILPLGVYTAAGSFTQQMSYLIDTPITDSADTVVGLITCTGITLAVPATLTIQLGIGYAYLIPATQHYYVEPIPGDAEYRS